MFIKQIPYILALEEKRKISTAAELLGISQSTMSKFLTKLELELGTQIFIRLHNQLELTPQGRIYVEAAKKINTLYYDTVASIQSLSTEQSVPLRICILCSREYAVMKVLLNEFYKKYPHVQISLYYEPNKRFSQILDHYFYDIVLFSSIETPDDNIQNLSMCEEEIILAVSASNIAVNAPQTVSPYSLPTIDFQYLRRNTFIMQPSFHPIRTVANRVFYTNLFKPDIMLELNNTSLILDMVKTKKSCAFVPKSYLCSDPSLTFFSLPQKYYLRKYLVYQNNPAMISYIQYFAYLMAELYLKDKSFAYVTKLLEPHTILNFNMGKDVL